MQQPSDRRTRKKQAVRQALEDAAVRLFDEQGFAETTIDQIADEADVSRSTFFRYFGSKEAVLFGGWGETGEILAGLILDRPEAESPLVAFENALIDLPGSLPIPPDPEVSIRLRRVIESTPALKARSEELTNLWRFSVAETLAQRDGVTEPRREHLLAAGIGLIIAQRVSDEFSVASADRSLEALIRDEFRLLRDLVR